MTWANVQLMMIDAFKTDYKAAKKGKPSESGTPDVLDLSDPKSINILKQISKG